MASTDRLPSGAWRCRATVTINGKKVTKTFTVHPDTCAGSSTKERSQKAKAKAEMMANEWQFSQNKEITYSLILSTAFDNYIKDRTNVLSPVSIKTYLNYIPYFESIKDYYVADIDSQTVQRLINDMAVQVSAKTIKCRIGFLLSVLDYAGNDKRFKLRYPQQIKRELTTPDHDQVYLLIQSADEIIKPYICLAAFGGLRRGEIAAIKQKDVSRDMRLISIHADMVLDKDNNFIYKEMPKTADSVRSVELPQDVIDLLPYSSDPESFVFHLSPTAITRRFEKLRDRLGFKVRFHDLRHYAASFRSDLGIPRKYIEDLGWSSDSKVLAQVYDNPLSSTRKKYVALANNYINETFGDVIRRSS